MAITQRLDLRQAQGLVMTPQLQQAIKLLQLSHVELTTFVENEIERNPLLEHDDAPPEGTTAEAPAEPVLAETSGAAEAEERWSEASGSEGEGNVDRGGDPAAWDQPRSRVAAEEDLPGLDQTLTRPETLRDHLQDQVRLDIQEPRERMIAMHLLDLLDEA